MVTSDNDSLHSGIKPLGIVEIGLYLLVFRFQSFVGDITNYKYILQSRVIIIEGVEYARHSDIPSLVVFVTEMDI